MAAEDEVGHTSNDGHATEAAPCNTPTSDRLLEAALAFWRSAVLISAHELGLFAELAAGPRDAGALGRCLGIRLDAIADLLEALLALHLVERSDDQYRNAPEARIYLDPAQPSYIGRWLTMAGAAMREMSDLTARLQAVRSSETESASPSDQMWADIAALLRTAREHDDA